MCSVNNCVYERPNHFGALQVFREQDDLCDVTIKVGLQEMRAHRLVLAATTNYFHRMFKAGFKESKKDLISIENVSEKSMQAFIEFSYTGKIVITKENAVNLLKDADFLELNDVKNKCVQYLESNVDVNNVCEVAFLAKLLPECTSLLKCSNTFIRKNLRDVSQTDAFTDLDVEILRAVLSEDTSRLSPALVLEVISDWASDDVEKKKSHVFALFDYVDLSKLEAQFLTDYLFKDRFKNSLGSKHSEFVLEVLSVLRKPKADIFSEKSKFCIFVYDKYGSNSDVYYDFTTDTWNDANIDPDKRIKLRCKIVVYKDKLYAFSKDDKDVFYVCNFDGTIRTYTVTETPFKSSDGSHLVLLDDCLYAFDIYVNKVWRFSLKTQTWQSVCPIRFGCCDWLALAVFQGHLYAAQDGMMGEYNPQTDSWTDVYTEDLCTRYAAMVGLNDKIYICGGWKDQSSVASVSAYDIKEKRWTKVSSMDTARSYHAAVAHEGKIWVIGGSGDNCKVLSSVEVYDPSTNLWSYGTSMPYPMKYPGAFLFATNS